MVSVLESMALGVAEEKKIPIIDNTYVAEMVV